jgi:hypothetical protein
MAQKLDVGFGGTAFGHAKSPPAILTSHGAPAQRWPQSLHSNFRHPVSECARSGNMRDLGFDQGKTIHIYKSEVGDLQVRNNR